jgi:hypothetical protein
MAAIAPHVQDAEGRSLETELIRGATQVNERIREGRFQSWMSLIAGLSAVLSGLEVAYEHWRGSYSRRVMYTPVILSAGLAGAGVLGFRKRWAARGLLRTVSAVSLADSLIGFYFHIRGVARKPGGWRLPLTNIIMGPPIFAPLLFGTSAYLGLVGSFLRDPGDAPGAVLPKSASRQHWLQSPLGHEVIGWEQDVREGRFQKQFAAATMISAFFSGFEAWYSHYKNNFRYWIQWTPIAISPALMIAAGASLGSRKAAHTALPAISGLAIIDGGIGFYYHARGVLKRPGGLKKPIYNILYGPPIFAPLLFAASGFLGVMASLLRREERKR